MEKVMLLDHDLTCLHAMMRCDDVTHDVDDVTHDFDVPR